MIRSLFQRLHTIGVTTITFIVGVCLVLTVVVSTAQAQIVPGQFVYNFNRPDATPLSSAAPELSADPYLVIRNGQLWGSLLWWGSATLASPLVTPNQIVQFTLRSSPSYHYLKLRISGSQFYLAAMHPGGVSISKYDNGTITTLATASRAIGVGDIVAFTAVGPTLNIKVNNIAVVTATDTQFSSGTAGLALYDPTAGIDDLVIGSYRAFTPPGGALPPAPPTRTFVPTPNQPPTADFVRTFEQGKTDGATFNASVPSFLTAASGANVVPHYGQSTTAQSSLFAAGRGQTAAPGIARAVQCETLGGTGTAFNQQECAAIAFMRQSPTTRPQFTVDRAQPFIAGTEAYVANPALALGTNALPGNYSACVQQTQTIPGSTRTEVCNDFSTIQNGQCSVGRLITLDPKHLYQCQEQILNLSSATCKVPRIVQTDRDYNYQCIATPNALVNQSCQRTLSVAITTADTCINGATLASVPMQHGLGPVSARCNYNQQDLVELRTDSATLILSSSEPVTRSLTTMAGLNISVMGGSGCVARPGPRAGPYCTYTLGFDLGVTFVSVCQPYDGGCEFVQMCVSGGLPDASGNCAPSSFTTISFDKASYFSVFNENWVNGCASFEARL